MSGASINGTAPFKTLVVKLSSLGDVVNTLPAARILRHGLEKKYGPVQMDWLVEEAASGILTGLSFIDNVIVVRRGWFSNFAFNRAVSARLRSEGYDLIVDFQGLLKSGAWVWLSGAKRKTGFSNAREMSWIFLNDRAAAYDPDMHAVERYFNLARFVVGGGEDAIDLKGAALEADEGAKKRIEEKLSAEGLKRGEKYFVLSPCARWAAKLWSAEKFIELGKKAASATGLPAVLVGAASDAMECGRMASAMNSGNARAVNMAGKTDLKELAELMRGARFVVTVDSGPMHIAAAVGASVAAIFGPTAPWRTGPHAAGAIVVRKGLDCSPCFKKECADLKCMKNISVDEVVLAVNSLVTGAGAGGATDR